MTLCMRSAALAAALLASVWSSGARADGVLVLQGRALAREGPVARGYCDAAGSGTPAECDRVLTKVLSGYSYGRGQLVAGVGLSDARDSAATSGVAALRVSWISAALPGGELALAALDAVLGDSRTRRLRLTLVDAEHLFFCRDAQSGALVLPVLGMFTRACRPDALFALDVGVLAMQWDISSDRLLGEWFRFGPVVSLLQNGFGYSHLLHSIELGVPLDVRSWHYTTLTRSTETSLGAGLRVAGFYRSPHWEFRGALRHRTALAGGAGIRHDNSLELDLRFLHNFFLSDAVVVQAGLSVRGSWSQKPDRTFAVWARSDRQYAGFAGLSLGWVHEAPDI